MYCQQGRDGAVWPQSAGSCTWGRYPLSGCVADALGSDWWKGHMQTNVAPLILYALCWFGQRQYSRLRTGRHLVALVLVGYPKYPWCGSPGKAKCRGASVMSSQVWSGFSYPLVTKFSQLSCDAQSWYVDQLMPACSKPAQVACPTFSALVGESALSSQQTSNSRVSLQAMDELFWPQCLHCRSLTGCGR
jgi:hypothetical protein